jgi:PadR family transcriptional regulator, regulatory protein PadR
MKIENAKAQMRKGLLEMCILSMLTMKEAYPSDIIEALKEHELIVVEGTLYPLLNRLKDAGLLTYSWRESATGPPRKYYKATPNGKMAAEELSQSWLRLSKSVSNIITKSGI